jgi:hypothetical protein
MSQLAGKGRWSSGSSGSNGSNGWGEEVKHLIPQTNKGVCSKAKSLTLNPRIVLTYESLLRPIKTPTRPSSWGRWHLVGGEVSVIYWVLSCKGRASASFIIHSGLKFVRLLKVGIIPCLFRCTFPDEDVRYSVLSHSPTVSTLVIASNFERLQSLEVRKFETIPSTQWRTSHLRKDTTNREV